MIVIGILQSHLLCEIISIDILTTHESCASVNGFSVIKGNYCMNNFTHQSNYYSLFICISDH